MRSAKFMSNEMIAQLFEELKKDQVRWTKSKELEFPDRPYSEDNDEPIPGRMAVPREFVDEKLGPDHGCEVGGLLILVQQSMHGFT